jgi:hypothetical protein
MTTNSRRSVKQHSSSGPRDAPAKQGRKAPARGKPGAPKGGESTTARRTAKSAAATAGRSTNKPRQKSK